MAMVRTIFLLYHDIDSQEYPSEKEDLATRETVVRSGEFLSHMTYLAETGWNVMSIREYLAKQEAGRVQSQDIVLTFDDGHISNYRLALPVLQKFGFSATFFIIAQRIGSPHHMGKAELNELCKAGMEIGSHGLTHTYLPELSTEEVEYELSESRNIIEHTVKEPVTSFAYPGGHYNPQILDSMRKSSYTTAASCIVGRNSLETDPYLLRRLEMRRNTSRDDFKVAIRTSTILFYQMIDGVKSGIKNIVGLERYKSLRQKFYFLYPFKR